MKIVCYGVYDTEVPFFHKENKFGYELELVTRLMNNENIDRAKDAEAVMIRGACDARAENIKKLHNFGVKYILTRTAGYNHVDLDAAKKYGIRVARVPAYSTNAIGELAVTLAMMLLRHTAEMVMQTSTKDFRVTNSMFSKEVRNCTVGILGVGKIGLTTAKLFKGLGAKVVGYDIYQSDDAKEVLEFLPLDEMLMVSDIVSMHIPYIKGENDCIINKDFLLKMKDDAILVNASRGDLCDDEAVLEAILNNTLGGFATDVFTREVEFFFKDMTDKPLPIPAIEKLIDCYPKVLVTPHIGAYTDEAVTNMIGISYENLNDILTTGTCVNEL